MLLHILRLALGERRQGKDNIYRDIQGVGRAILVTKMSLKSFLVVQGSLEDLESQIISCVV